MQILRKLEVSINFSSKSLINSLDGGRVSRLAPVSDANACFPDYPKFFSKVFFENSIKFESLLKKMAKFPLKLSKFAVSIDFRHGF